MEPWIPRIALSRVRNGETSELPSRHVKCVALARVAAIKATAEPGHALSTGAVCELIFVALAKRVVADLVRGIERFAQIRLVDRKRRARGMSPDASEAIGLQLNAHRRLVLALALNLNLRRADQILHVVTNFVRDDIGLREIARRAQTITHQIIEARVDVEFVVARAVERTNF